MDCFFEDRQDRCASAAAELHSEIHTLRIRWSFSCGQHRKKAVPSFAFFLKSFLFLWSFVGMEFRGVCLGKIEALFFVTMPWRAHRKYRRTHGTALPILYGAFFGSGIMTGVLLISLRVDELFFKADILCS